MKHIITLLFVFYCSAVFTQDQRNIIGAGLETISYSTNDDILLINDSYQSAFLEYDWVSSGNFTMGLEFHKSISSKTDVLDGRAKVGYVFNGQSRIQIPLFGYLGMYRLKEENSDVLGRFMVGIKAGIRFYVTDNISLQGVYHITGYEISRIGDRTFQESVGNLKANGIALSIQYYISK